MERQLPRNSNSRSRGPIDDVEKAQVTAETQELLKAAMVAPHFPTNFVPPMPARPKKFPNIRIEDHTRSHQASVLQIRRPMSAEMAKWVVQQLEASPKTWIEEAATYSLALEFRDAYRNLGREVPEGLVAHIAALKRAQPSRDNELKLETRVVYGPVVGGHAAQPSSSVWSALPATSGRVYDKWDKKCREVYGATIGLGALLAPATVVYNNLQKSAGEIQGLLQYLGENPTALRTLESPGHEVVHVPALVAGTPPEETAARPGRVSLGEMEEPVTKRARVSIGEGDEQKWEWLNKDWMCVTEPTGERTCYPKGFLPHGARKRAQKLAPARAANASPVLPLMPHDLMLPGGATLARRPAETDWRSAPVEI